MNKWCLILATALVSMSTYAAEPVENKKGRLLYSGSCASKYAFVYQDGSRLKRPCIGATDALSVEEFLRKARLTDCDSRVRVKKAVIDGNVLYATEVEEVFACFKGD